MSNYTTNADDHKEGWNPISHATLTYGHSKRFPEMRSGHYDYIERIFGLDTTPSEAGYNLMNLSYDLPSVYGDVGSSLVKPAKLIVRLRDTILCPEDLDQDANDESEDIPDEFTERGVVSKNSSTFKIKVRMLVQRHIEFMDGKVVLDDETIAI